MRPRREAGTVRGHEAGMLQVCSGDGQQTCLNGVGVLCSEKIIKDRTEGMGMDLKCQTKIWGCLTLAESTEGLGAGRQVIHSEFSFRKILLRRG